MIHQRRTGRCMGIEDTLTLSRWWLGRVGGRVVSCARREACSERIPSGYTITVTRGGYGLEDVSNQHLLLCWACRE